MAGRNVWFYASKLAWPDQLIFIYPRWDIDGTAAWQYFFPAAALGVAGVLLWLCRRWRGPLAGFLFFVGTLFPALGFFDVYPFRYSFVADHFQYLACLGIVVPAAAGLALLANRVIPKFPGLRIGLGAGLLLVLGAMSWQRAWAYKTEETLWITTLNQNPACWMADNNLGIIRFHQGRLDDAVDLYQKALSLNPACWATDNNLGTIRFQQGQLDDAIDLYQKALALNPAYDEALDNLGLALTQKGREDEAFALYQKAVAINPNFPEALNNLGIALMHKGKVDEAMAQFQKALEVNPQFSDAHENLGVALFTKGRLSEAIPQLEEAARLDPGSDVKRANLAKAQAKAGLPPSP